MDLCSSGALWRQARIDFFEIIAARLRPGGILASSDLASDAGSSAYGALLEAWMNMMLAAGIPAAGLEQMRTNYSRDVAILPHPQVAAIISVGGIDEPELFYQAGLMHAWFSRMTSRPER